MRRTEEWQEASLKGGCLEYIYLPVMESQGDGRLVQLYHLNFYVKDLQGILAQSHPKSWADSRSE